MLRSSARILTLFRTPAFRRVLAAMVIIGLASGPFLNALNAGHAEEIGEAVAGISVGFSDPGGLVSDSAVVAAATEQDDLAGKTPPLGDASSGDHSCHGCSVVLMAAMDSTRFDRMPSGRLSVELPSATGRIVPADLRPPRA